MDSTYHIQILTVCLQWVWEVWIPLLRWVISTFWSGYLWAMHLINDLHTPWLCGCINQGPEATLTCLLQSSSTIISLLPSHTFQKEPSGPSCVLEAKTLISHPGLKTPFWSSSSIASPKFPLLLSHCLPQLGVWGRGSANSSLGINSYLAVSSRCVSFSSLLVVFSV